MTGDSRTGAAWVSISFLFRPEAGLMVGAPLIFQLHSLSAFVLFALHRLLQPGARL